MQKSSCCVPEGEDLQSKPARMQCFSWWMGCRRARSNVEVACPWTADPVRMAWVVFMTWGNIVSYNFGPNVCESLKQMYVVWQEKITSHHVTVGILFSGSVLVGGEMLGCSWCVGLGGAYPPSRCDSALQVNSVGLPGLICLVGVQALQFLQHSNSLRSFERQI